MRKRGDGALTQPKAERGAILARPAGGANTDYHSSRRWPRRSISVPQIAQVQPPHKACRTEAGRRNLGTGVPHSGQPPCALTSSCTFTDHNRAANAPIAAEIPTISIFPRRAGPGPPNLMRPHDCRPYRLDEASATVCGCRVLILEVCEHHVYSNHFACASTSAFVRARINQASMRATAGAYSRFLLTSNRRLRHCKCICRNRDCLL